LKKKPLSRGIGLMLKDNVNSKFDYIGTFEPNAPHALVVEDQKAAW
jgi:hypothetical protein